MSDDPRAQDRQREHGRYGDYLTYGKAITQEGERINQALSPADDELPMAQAVRAKEEMARNIATHRELRLRRQNVPDVPA